MKEKNQTHRRHSASREAELQRDPRPFWKRAHRDWRVIAVILLMLTCMFIYIISDDLAWRPRVK